MVEEARLLGSFISTFEILRDYLDSHLQYQNNLVITFDLLELETQEVHDNIEYIYGQLEESREGRDPSDLQISAGLVLEHVTGQLVFLRNITAEYRIHRALISSHIEVNHGLYAAFQVDYN